MYLPPAFAESRPEVLEALVRRHPLGALVVPTEAGLSVDHVPFLIAGDRLTAHVARANPIWQRARAGEAVAIFQGTDRYVTPSWYPSKAEHGQAVPTWNYVVVHAHGPVRWIEDRAWLRAHLEALVAAHEEPRAAPWRITDAPADYIEKLLGAIVGLELGPARLEGKWKVSQNRNAADRAGVVAGLSAEGGTAMAALVQTAGDERDR